jgi:hypothetical protein
LSALALSALTALTALSGLLLLLAWLLLAAAALLLARLVLAALLLAGVLLVRIVHNVSYFGFSPVMTTIVTPLGCSRSELNSERTKFREGAGGYEGESRSRAAEEKPSAAPLLAQLSPKRGEVIDLVYFHGKSVTEIAAIVGIAKAGGRWHGAAMDGPTAPGGLWRSRWSGTDFFLLLLSGPPVVAFFDRSAAALF